MNFFTRTSIIWKTKSILKTDEQGEKLGAHIYITLKNKPEYQTSHTVLMVEYYEQCLIQLINFDYTR